MLASYNHAVKPLTSHTYICIVCEGHTEEEGADGVTGLVNAPPFDEKTPLLRTVSRFMNVKKQRISQAISVRLLHAASGVEQRGRCEEKATNSACPWNLYHLELESGVKYKLEVLSAGETLSVITFAAPGTGQLPLAVCAE